MAQSCANKNKDPYSSECDTIKDTFTRDHCHELM